MMYTRLHQPAALTIDPAAFDTSATHPVYKEQWVAICGTRLAELRPHAAVSACTALANDMWADVASFDPYIAAEMEHESCIFDD